MRAALWRVVSAVAKAAALPITSSILCYLFIYGLAKAAWRMARKLLA